MDESYRNGACRRLCIRRGGRQTDEAIDEGHSPVVKKAGRNPNFVLSCQTNIRWYNWPSREMTV
jgi:hypothetical protein